MLSLVQVSLLTFFYGLTLVGLIFVSRKKIKKLNSQISFLTENERLAEVELRAMQDMIFQKTIELKDQRNMTLHASKMSALGEMAGGIAHEINNPLTIINSTIRKITRKIQSENPNIDELNKDFMSIGFTADRISRIVKGLKLVSQDASNEVIVSMQVGDILSDVLSLCGEKIIVNGIELLIDLNEPDFQTIILCRRVQLTQVFLNLLLNSYNAIEKDTEKWIKVECARKEHNLVLHFVDSGLGIPEKEREKIFQPFFTTNEIGKGLGLGLSISSSIIKNHNGELFVDAERKNTCFVVVLPIAN